MQSKLDTIYRAIVEEQTDLIALWRTDQTIIFVNGVYRHFFNYRSHSGEKFLDGRMPAKDTAKFEKHISLLGPLNPVDTFEHRMVMSNGEVRWLQWTNRAIFNEENCVTEFLSVGRDITDRKSIEYALIESERRLTEIINFSPDATFVIDPKGSVIVWNCAIETMTGVRREKILGKGNYEYALPFYDCRRPILIDLVLSPDKIRDVEYPSLCSDQNSLTVETDITLNKGKAVCLWAKASPIYNRKGEMVGAIESIRDITERKKAEQVLRQREKELQIKSHNLQEANTALKVLLEHREKDRADIEGAILSNFKELIIPYLEKLKRNPSSRTQLKDIHTIELNLKNILSPFLRNVSSLQHLQLTPTETRIAVLVKDGKTTKEIAETLHISARAVEFHRDNIREKLGIKNSKVNLRSYLLSLS